MHGRAKQFGEGIMVPGYQSSCRSFTSEVEEDEITVLPISVPDSDGTF